MNTISNPESITTTIDCLKLHYLDWGTSNNKTPMLLLHGLCSNAHYWDLFASNMKHEYRVLALDQRGHGGSSWAKEYGPKYFITDLESFITKLNLNRLILIGHSMGGIIAMIYTAQHPEQIDKLVIIDIGPEIHKEGIERMEMERASEPDEFYAEADLIAHLRRRQPRYSDAFIVHQAKCSTRLNQSGKLIFKRDKALKRAELRSSEWLWDYLMLIVCPTLILHGSESDILSPQIARKMVDALAFGSTVDIERAGHGIPGDNPENFEAEVRKFLHGIGY